MRKGLVDGHGILLWPRNILVPATILSLPF